MDDLEFGDDDDLGDCDDDLDVGDGMADPEPVDEMAGISDMGEGSGGFAPPKAGRALAACWVTNSYHAAMHMAAGDSTKAMQLLNRQIAVSDFSVVKDTMIRTYIASFMSMPGVPGSSSMSVPLLANDSSGNPGSESSPRTSLKIKKLVTGIHSGHRFFHGGKFNDAKAAFTSVLNDIPLVVTHNRSEANEIKEMLEICREYIIAIHIKGAISGNMSNQAR